MQLAANLALEEQISICKSGLGACHGLALLYYIHIISTCDFL